MPTNSARYANHAPYTKALLDYASQINDVTPLEELRDSLFAKIQSGDGRMMIVANPGGKMFEYQVTISNEDAFACVVAAIRQFNDEPGDSPITFLDFSRS